MEISIFTNKSIIPGNDDLKSPLGETYPFWFLLRDYVFDKYPTAKEEWNYPGKNYGWSFRIKDKNRAIIYFLPREGYFKVAFVFGQKATDQVMASRISEEIKTELRNAKVYMEGRGIGIEVRDESKLPDIKNLIEIKISN
ncbi:MAG: DUF3788 domain-containing protein [Bacteroidetes bacterium]|nr:DUF3788 domain-containing protein [Bacteroidota bacterium]